MYGSNGQVAHDYLDISAIAVEDEGLGRIVLPFRSSQTPTVRDLPHYSDFGITRAFDLHSMAMHVALLWAEGRSTEWQSASPQLWNGFFDAAVADALPEAAARDAKPRGDANSSAVMASAIAYSAIDPSIDDNSAKPFGDTGIWSMFNDAGDLGNVLAGDEAVFFGRTLVPILEYCRVSTAKTSNNILRMFRYNMQAPWHYMMSKARRWPGLARMTAC